MPSCSRCWRGTREIAQAGGGAFDPTVGPLVALWREARRTGRMPDATVIARDAATADALATALTVLSPEDGMRFLARYHRAVGNKRCR